MWLTRLIVSVSNNSVTLTFAYLLNSLQIILINLFIYLFRAAPAAYGGSQARGPVGAIATGLCQSHCNAGSEPQLRPTPQLRAPPDP